MTRHVRSGFSKARESKNVIDLAGSMTWIRIVCASLASRVEGQPIVNKQFEIEETSATFDIGHHQRGEGLRDDHDLGRPKPFKLFRRFVILRDRIMGGNIRSSNGNAEETERTRPGRSRRTLFIGIAIVVVVVSIGVALALTIPKSSKEETHTNSNDEPNSSNNNQDEFPVAPPPLAPSMRPSSSQYVAPSELPQATDGIQIVSNFEMTITPFNSRLTDQGLILLWQSVTSQYLQKEFVAITMDGNNADIEVLIVDQILVTGDAPSSSSSTTLQMQIEENESVSYLVIEFMVEIHYRQAQENNISANWTELVRTAWENTSSRDYLIQLQESSVAFSQVSGATVSEVLTIDPAPQSSGNLPSPTMLPSMIPSTAPTTDPTTPPSWAPITETPSLAPSTNAPMSANTLVPTKQPSGSSPTKRPTKSPTPAPTPQPTPAPTPNPSVPPTHLPTIPPATMSPTKGPTTPRPSRFPTRRPSDSPTAQPITGLPTNQPTKSPVTLLPTPNPTPRPTTSLPTQPPTPRPTTLPPTTKNPTPKPTANPTPRPTPKPTSPQPTKSPSKHPTPAPTPQPTPQPTPAPVTATIEGSFELLETVPHDSSAFTQGLELIPDTNPQLYYESTGLYGESSMRIVNLATGQVQQQHNLDRLYFGEGMTAFDSGTKLFQITWKANTAFIYDASTLEVLQVINSYTTTSGQGWGICFVESTNMFHVSDGTNYLHQWDASTLQFLGKVPVHTLSAGSTSTNNIRNINELEWDPYTSTVLANVWFEDYLLRIDPATGFATHRYNLESLFRPPGANVLNGIAAIPDAPNEIWVTGKRWPNMYRIRLLD